MIGRTPVMALPWAGRWVFRVPLYVIEPEFELAIPSAEQTHAL